MPTYTLRRACGAMPRTRNPPLTKKCSLMRPPPDPEEPEPPDEPQAIGPMPGCAKPEMADTGRLRLPSGDEMAPEMPPMPSVRTEVALSVYALKGASALNAVTELAGLGGAYHVGVEIHCLEWSFGYCEQGSGVQNVYAGCSEAGTFKQRVCLGPTPCEVQEVIAILGELREAWPGRSYNLLRRNCAHFSMDLVRRLRVQELPSWVNSLAALLDWVATWVEAKNRGEPTGATALLKPPKMPTPETAVVPTTCKGDLAAAAAEQAKEQEACVLDWVQAQEYMLERAADAARVQRKLAHF